MLSTTLNFITTTLLTISCAAALLFAYRRAIRPILIHYGIPLQSLPSFLGRRSRGWMDTQYRRMNADDTDMDDEDERQRRIRRESRDLEEGFRDDSDEEEERGEGGRSRLQNIEPRTVEDEMMVGKKKGGEQEEEESVVRKSVDSGIGEWNEWADDDEEDDNILHEDVGEPIQEEVVHLQSAEERGFPRTRI